MKNSLSLKRHLAFALLSAALLCCAEHFDLAYAQTSDFVDALQLYRQGETAQASAMFEKEISANPGNDAAYYYLAVLTMGGDNPSQADIEKSETLLKKALELSPDNFWYKYHLALFYANTDRVELTSSLLEELIAEYPKKQNLYFDAANAYLAQDDIDKAILTLDKIEALSGRNEMIAMTKLELMRKKGGMTPGQLYGFLEQYYTDCRTPRIATLLGDYYQELYRDSLALGYYSQAIEMDENFTMAYFGRAHVYQLQRNYDAYFSDISHFLSDKDIRPEAKADYINSLMENPQFVIAFTPQVDTMVLTALKYSVQDSTLNTVAGVYFYKTERNDTALEILRRNMVTFSDSYSIALHYLLILHYCEKWDEVIDLATVMRMKFPGGNEVLQLRGISFWHKNDYPNAIEDYRALLDAAPRDSANVVSCCSALGDLYHLAGNSKSAYKYYEKALKCAPDYVPVLNNYAFYLSLEGKDLKRARKMSKVTIEREPDNPTYLDTYAWILHLMGDDIEAKAMFKHAMLYGAKDSAVILDHYADVLFALKEYDLAFIYWRQADAADPSLNIGDKIKTKKVEMQKK